MLLRKAQNRPWNGAEKRPRARKKKRKCAYVYCLLCKVHAQEYLTDNIIIFPSTMAKTWNALSVMKSRIDEQKSLRLQFKFPKNSSRWSVNRAVTPDNLANKPIIAEISGERKLLSPTSGGCTQRLVWWEIIPSGLAHTYVSEGCSISKLNVD